MLPIGVVDFRVLSPASERRRMGFCCHSEWVTKMMPSVRGDVVDASGIDERRTSMVALLVDFDSTERETDEWRYWWTSLLVTFPNIVVKVTMKMLNH